MSDIASIPTLAMKDLIGLFTGEYSLVENSRQIRELIVGKLRRALFENPDVKIWEGFGAQRAVFFAKEQSKIVVLLRYGSNAHTAKGKALMTIGASSAHETIEIEGKLYRLDFESLIKQNFVIFISGG